MIIKADLTYVQLLEKECYIKLILPLRPNVIIPYFNIIVTIQESQGITTIKIPEIRKTITDNID